MQYGIDIVKREKPKSSYAYFPRVTLGHYEVGSKFTGWSNLDGRTSIRMRGECNSLCTQSVNVNFFDSEVAYVVALKDVNGKERHVYSETHKCTALRGWNAVPFLFN